MKTNASLVYGEKVGNSALDKASARARDGEDANVRIEEAGCGWRVYVSRYRYITRTFATRLEAEQALAEYRTAQSARRAAKQRHNAAWQLCILPHAEGGVYISSRKYAPRYPLIAGPFNTKEEAAAHAKANIDTLAKWRPVEPERATVPVDLTGRQIDPSTLLERFGLRGVEFGVWETARVGALAALVADALQELARVIGRPEFEVGLEGKHRLGGLALALGARGHGKASAHYEHARNVINLTKTRGAGTLAHEWGHALDFCLRDCGIGERLNPVRLAIRECVEWRRASKLLDAGRAKPYWASDEELLARSFEAWVNTNTDNRFLVCLDGYAETMPQGAELERICAAWEQVFPGR